MADESTFGGGLGFDVMSGGTGTGGFDSGASLGGGEGAGVDHGTDELPVNARPTEGQGLPMPKGPQPPSPSGFGAAFSTFGPPNYRANVEQDALGQSADLLQQRIERANKVQSNPFVQLFNPEGAAKAREFIPQATEQLLKIQGQRSTIQANKQQAETLGLSPGEGGLTDYSTQAERVAVAQQRALKGDLGTFRGLMTVDPKAAEAIQDRVYETVAGHLDRANTAYGTLANMSTPQEYDAAVRMLRKNGTLSELETLGLKVPSYQEFQAQKAGMGRTLREASIGANAIRTKLEERNTYMPMEKKEAETYSGSLTTAYGDKIENGVWSRNSAAGTRGFVVNGMGDPRELGKTFTLATQDQRKAIGEDWDRAVPKEQLEKYRENERTYKLAVTDPKTGKKLPEGEINTNPNVQQGIAEGLAAALRGGTGGANVGLLKIETGKRGVVQGVIDEIVSAKAGALNTLTAKEIQPYLSKLTQAQVRYVMDFLHAYNEQHIGDVGSRIAERAGALGLGPEALGLTKTESGGLADAFERGRNAQIERMMPNHQAIGGNNGVLQLGAQRPGVGAGPIPAGTEPTQQLPGVPALRTPVQQAIQPQPPSSPAGGPAGPNQTAPNPTGGPGGSGPAPSAPQPIRVASADVNVPIPPGASPDYFNRAQRIETPGKRDPWTSGQDGNLSTASGAFQFINGTWEQYKPAGAPARAKDATPQQQAEAMAAFTAANARKLQGAGLPVNDTTLYIAHNVGDGGAKALLTADPNADARSIVGEKAASNNPKFFRGKPTVAMVLERYRDAIEGAPPDDGPKPKPGSGGAAAEPSFWDKLTGRKPGEMVTIEGDIQGDRIAAPAERAKSPVVEHAPAIASTVAGVGGSLLGPVGGVAGGAAGGAAGQSFKDWMQGRGQDPAAIAKEGALGAVFGITSAARPIAATAVRVGGAGAVEGGAAAIEGKDAGEVAEAAGGGMLSAAGGEAFGRALGMAGHKLWSRFNDNVQTQLHKAADELNSAREVMQSTEAKLATGGANPVYQAAEQRAQRAEVRLKDAGLNPDEAAYAAQQTAAKTPRAEALANRPAAVEGAEVTRGYDQLRGDVEKAGVGAPKPAPKLPDGPVSVAAARKMSAADVRRAEEAEMLVTAPAPTWGAKWDQLVEARSKLLASERTALDSTSANKDILSTDRRALADAVRAQQKKLANYVFGPGKGDAAIKRLELLDKRYAILQKATGGGDVLNIASLSGQKGRDADKAFRAFAHDDPQAIAAWDHLRRTRGTHSGEGWLHAAIHLPFVGQAISAGRMALLLHRWNVVRAAGGNVKFRDLVRDMPADNTIGQTLGTAGARAATM